MAASTAAVKARPVLSTVSTTLMPFLYQTRSLISLPSIAVSLKSQAAYVAPVAKVFSTSAKQSAPLPIRSTYQARDGRSQFPSTAVRAYKSRRSPNGSARSEDEIPFETDESTGRGSRQKRWSMRPTSSSKLDDFGEPEDEPFPDSSFIDDAEGMVTDDQMVGAGSMNLRGPRESTITDSEHRAFQNIFNEMCWNQKASTSPDPNVLSLRGHAKVNLGDMLNDALAVSDRNKEEKESMVSRWPEALRPAVAKAIGLTDDGESDEGESIESEPPQPELQIDELESLRDPERQRVEKLMREAVTDVELWEVMNKEVFSMIPRLGLAEKSSTHDSKPKGKRVSKKEKQQMQNSKVPSTTGEKLGSDNQEKRQESSVSSMLPTTDADEVAKGLVSSNLDNVLDSTTGYEIPALTFYGPLYPSYLLLGIRLLDRDFVKPSPLALSVLPKIKSLGAISHVLGASPSLYNEILRIYLLRHEDFRAMTATLYDMNDSAVPVNEETLAIVEEVLRLARQVQEGERGPVIQRIWSQMPRFTTKYLNAWRKKHASAIAAGE
ncbi:hypothetical protein GLAREA_04644 [Glarea lozoyensis ATCC 20868]|uniref:Mtf2-like C-terminal domain-containing protein n=1 Tax=Glarea lozoyensis (strain ATCC 20868 / MF5171) TaxID=1116229 RepID=S3DMZ2_GLAL2|nr:uncharacterized protein GLAREA_04644 [Glarea lozoyensis ATCC 20868]EPE27853.1 hypothetical protein GLAREA_04644 [Glarea lozoyensis ATCC 20868]